jgi:hypothetical protein
MNAFETSSLVEARAMAILAPFIAQRAHDGRFVLLDKGPLARALQETVGDVIMTGRDGLVRSVEIKAEEKYTGNLFFEVWSNWNFDDPMSRHTYPPNPGWACKSNADLLLNYFLDNDRLYVVDLMKLQRWAFSEKPGGEGERIDDFPIRLQKKSAQKNRTKGRIISWDIIEKHVGCRLIHPKKDLKYYREDARIE